MRKLGTILAIATAVAAVPLVAMAWQGPDPAPGSSWGRHWGPSHMDSGSFGWGRMGHWMDPAVAQAPAAAPGAGLPSQSKAAPTLRSAGLLDPPTTPDDTTWMGCPMWDLYPDGLPDGYPLPDYPDGTVPPGYGPTGCPMWSDLNPDGLPDGYPLPGYFDGTVPPGYGPGGCPMWGGSYPDLTPGIPVPPDEGYGYGWGGHMWGRGMMHGGW